MSSNYNQATKLAEIGAQLKQTREDKDISLHQVKATTLISERHLRAIEEGNLDLLPEPVYVQGFIRKYGNVVGLDGLAEEFPLSTPETAKNWSSSPAAELRPFHLYVLYILVIAGAVSILATFLNPSSASKINDKETNLSKSAQLSSGTTKSSKSLSKKPTEVYGPPIPNSVSVATLPLPPSPVPVEKNSEANAVPAGSWVDINSIVKQGYFTSGFSFPTNKSINVGIVMAGQSWVRVKVDGETKFEGVLSEGTRQSWSADKDIVVRAGNAAAVMVAFNRQPVKPMGSEGEVAQQKFDAAYKPASSFNLNTSVSSSADNSNLQTNWLGNMFKSN